MTTLLGIIIQEFDLELNRLNSLRAIIAGLGSPVVAKLDDRIGLALSNLQMAAAKDTKSDIPATTPSKRRYTRRSAGGPVVRRARKPRFIEAGAIASVIPTGPVVVSAAALERERRMRESTTTTAPIEAVGPKPLTAEDSTDLARTLASRWLRG